MASYSKKTEVKKVIPIIQVSSTENTTCSSRTGKKGEQSLEIKATNRKESGTQRQTQPLEIKRLSADVSPPKPISSPHAATNKVFVFSSRVSRQDCLSSRSPTQFPAKVRANQVSHTKIEPSYFPSSSPREPTACPKNSSPSHRPGCSSLSSRTRHPGRIRACLD